MEISRGWLISLVAASAAASPAAFAQTAAQPPASLGPSRLIGAFVGIGGTWLALVALLLFMMVLVLWVVLPFAVWRIRREVIEMARMQRLASTELHEVTTALARFRSEGQHEEEGMRADPEDRAK